MPPPAEALHGGLVADQGHHDLTVLRGGLAADDDQIAGKDTSAGHAATPDLEGEELLGREARLHEDVSLGRLHRGLEITGLHVTHEGNVSQGEVSVASARRGKAEA